MLDLLCSRCGNVFFKAYDGVPQRISAVGPCCGGTVELWRPGKLAVVVPAGPEAADPSGTNDVAIADKARELVQAIEHSGGMGPCLEFSAHQALVALVEEVGGAG